MIAICFLLLRGISAWLLSCLLCCRCNLCHSSPYNPIFRFHYSINGMPADMTFSSVAGHLMEVGAAEQLSALARDLKHACLHAREPLSLLPCAHGAITD